MLRQVAPGEVIGPNCSEEMLQAAQGPGRGCRADSTRCAEAESFTGSAEASSFDIVTLRASAAAPGLAVSAAAPRAHPPARRSRRDLDLSSGTRRRHAICR